MPNLRILASALLVGVAAVAVDADTIVLADGRSFTGEIVTENPDVISIDTVVSNVRATLTFSKSETTSIERGELPEDYYSPPPPAPRVSDRGKFDNDDTLYLEVPIHGMLGTDVSADGVAAALRYAQRHDIGHIVFTIDSTGGSVDEAARIYQMLKKAQGSVQMHALVRECLGASIAVGLWCDTIYIEPGGHIGGSPDLQFERNPDAAALQKQVMQSQVANEVAGEARRRGGDGNFVLAFLDPRQQYAAWLDEYGKVHDGYKPPAGIDPSRLIFEIGPDELLVLSAEQCELLGVPIVEGGVAAMGDELEVTDWQPESDYGLSVMRKSQLSKEKQEAALQNKYESQVKKNIERREKTARYIETNVDQAKQWDPFEGQYATYGGVVNQRRGYLRVGGSSTPYYSKDSQRDWRYRSDTCITYVEKALNGAYSMRTLDDEAEKLGLEPTYGRETLNELIQEAKVHLDYLKKNRNRKGA